ncbi:MAG TPA: pseudouridine synthase [Pirellulales bacterium]|nr:pseudouridine synthase [Pirellulales bacterium]
MRLQKILAAAGIGSRRQCEELIRQGRVDVDGQTVTELGIRVDPIQQKIRVDSELVHRPKRKLYFLVNKPAGVLSTNHDPSGRPRVIDFAPSQQRLFTVGRLDQSSSGLILVTNDGVLTDLLTHPRYGVEKIYVALVAGVPTPEALAKLQRGVHLAEGYAHAKRVSVRRSHRHSTLLEIVLDEGRNREVRRLLARIGHKVLSLKRVAMGPLRLGNLQPGETRPLRQEEIEQLYAAAQEGRKSGKRPRKNGRGDRAESSGSAGSGRRSGKGTGVDPIIDKSLPVDADLDPGDSAFTPSSKEDFNHGAKLSDESDDWESEDDMESDEREVDEEMDEAEIEASKDRMAGIEISPIDVSPLGANRDRRNKARTVIGGERSPSPRVHGRKKRRRDRQRGRGKRDRR